MRQKTLSRLPLWLAVAAALVLAGCDEPQTKQAAPPPPKITVAKPVVKPIVEMDDFTGRFEAKEDVQVRARVAGYLEKIHFTDGALIKKGDLLFTIDQRPFQAEMDNASSSVEVAKTRRIRFGGPVRRSVGRMETCAGGWMPTITVDGKQGFYGYVHQRHGGIYRAL